MKTLFILVLTILFSTVCVAQNGINYKAVIKDDNGNVITNEPVIVQFAILQGVAQTNVYQEYHTPTTDANGLIIINIGEGVPIFGTFSAINWASDTTFLNTQIDTGTGMVDMGTTEFKTVPYALQAKNVASKEFISENGVTHTTTITDDFVVGSQTLDYNAVNDNTNRMFFNKTKGAFRAGASGIYIDPFSWDDDLLGINSFASGMDNTASGFASFAMGFGNLATNSSSMALGTHSFASGESSFAMGSSIPLQYEYTIASGDRSVAFGTGVNTTSYNSSAFGRYNVGGGNANSWVAIDPLFEIGNGTGSGSRTNALTVLKNGTIIAPSFDLAEITNPKSLITKEYADTNLGATGLETLNEGNGIGWRLKGRNPNDYGNIGLGAVDLSYNSVYSGPTGATGNFSIAMGYDTSASGYGSTTIGGYTKALGTYSTAIGSGTTASSYKSVAIGSYNIGGGNAITWVDTDPLFEVGFGLGSSSKRNAITVLKNGKIGIGTSTPSTYLHVTNGSDASYSSTSGFMVLGSTSGSNLVFDENEIIARNNGAISTLFLQQDGGDVRVGGVVVHSSDFRLKKDIAPLTYGLETILELNPVEYNWKNREQEFKSLGLIAQEVQPVIENIVHTADDEDKTLSVSYTELIPVLINAVKQLKAENDALRYRIETLENNKKHL